MSRYRRYTSNIIVQEGKLFLQGYSLNQISRKLNIPLSTVSWHLINSLKYSDYDSWIKVRASLYEYAHNPVRKQQEKELFDSIGFDFSTIQIRTRSYRPKPQED